MLKFALVCKYYEARVCSQQNKENISDIYKMYNKEKTVVFNDSSTSQKHWAMCTSPSSFNNSPETSGK